MGDWTPGARAGSSAVLGQLQDLHWRELGSLRCRLGRTGQGDLGKEGLKEKRDCLTCPRSEEGAAVGGLSCGREGAGGCGLRLRGESRAVLGARWGLWGPWRRLDETPACCSLGEAGKVKPKWRGEDDRVPPSVPRRWAVGEAARKEDEGSERWLPGECSWAGEPA